MPPTAARCLQKTGNALWWSQLTQPVVLLRALSSLLAKNTTGDYRDEMNGELFIWWFTSQLLPALEQPPVMVMDNVPYHIQLIEETRCPTTATRRTEKYLSRNMQDDLRSSASAVKTGQNLSIGWTTSFAHWATRSSACHPLTLRSMQLSRCGGSSNVTCAPHRNASREPTCRSGWRKPGSLSLKR